MKSKSFIALSILCLALGACATTDTASDDATDRNPETEYANQHTPAARASDVDYTTLTPRTEQVTVKATTTEPVWSTTVENQPVPATSLTQNDSSATASGSVNTDNTATISGTTSTTTSTTTTNTPMTSSSTMDDDDDDDDTTTTTTETRRRMRKD